MEKRSKRLRIALYPLWPELKQNVYSSNNEKSKLMKYYFEVFVIKNYFQNEKNIHQNSQKSHLKNVISWIPSSVQILN